MKKEYVIPAIEIVLTESEDIIRTSNETDPMPVNSDGGFSDF